MRRIAGDALLMTDPTIGTKTEYGLTGKFVDFRRFCTCPTGSHPSAGDTFVASHEVRGQSSVRNPGAPGCRSAELSDSVFEHFERRLHGSAGACRQKRRARRAA